MIPEKVNLTATFESKLIDEINELENVDIPPGTTILKEHEYVKAVPIVLEGSVKLRKIDSTGREIIFYHIEAGESCILSITSCLNEKQSQAEAIVEKDTRVILVSADKVRKWLDEYPTWRKFVMKLYYERMAIMMELVDNVLFKSMDSRLVQYLKKYAVNNQLEITHQQIAAELGTAREVISRILKQMENDRSIALERGKIKIIRPL